MLKVRKGDCEEITLVQGKERRLRPARMAERSHPMSEVRGRSREDSMLKGRRPRGVTPRPRSGAVARRSYPKPPCPRPGAVAGRTNPTSKELYLRGHRRA